MAEKCFSLVQNRGFSHFVLHVNRSRLGPEVKEPLDLYWWAELNFGQEPVGILSFDPRSCFLTTKLPRIFSLLLAACGNSSDE